MPHKHHSFNVLLNDSQYQHLTELAELSNLNKSQVIRQCLHWRFTMEIKSMPVCATGAHCLAPQFHQFPKAPQT